MPIEWIPAEEYAKRTEKSASQIYLDMKNGVIPEENIRENIKNITIKKKQRLIKFDEEEYERMKEEERIRIMKREEEIKQAMKDEKKQWEEGKKKVREIWES